VAVELHAGIDRDVISVEQADVAAEKRNESLVQPQTEDILVCALKKEGAFFRKVKRIRRDVDLPRVNFGLRKVGVHRYDCGQLGGNPPRRFAAACARPVALAWVVGIRHRAAQVRGKLESESLLQGIHDLHVAGAAHIVEVGVEGWRGPAFLGLVARDVAIDLQTPVLVVAGKIESLGGNPHLGGPAIGCARGAGIPDAVPIDRKIGSSRPRDQPVGESACRVHLERVAGALIPERIEGDRYQIISKGGSIPFQRVRLDRLRIGVEAMETENKRIVIDQDFDFGFVGRGLARPRGLLREDQGLSGLPIRLIQLAIDSDGTLGLSYLDHRVRLRLYRRGRSLELRRCLSNGHASAERSAGQQQGNPTEPAQAKLQYCRIYAGTAWQTLPHVA
jgi:hypothetical protein